MLVGQNDPIRLQLARSRWREPAADMAEIASAGKRVSAAGTADFRIFTFNGEEFASRARSEVGDLAAAKTIAPYIVGKRLGATRRDLKIRVQRMVGGWRSLVGTFERASRTAADALLQSGLARILRHEDCDLECRAVRPWLPPDLAAMRMAVAS